MPTADQIKALIQSHLEGDEDRFFSVALRVAAHEARSGNARFAQELRNLIDEARARARAKPARPVPLVQPRGEFSGLFTAAYPKTRLRDMSLDADTEKRLRRVLLEQRQEERLRAHGLSPQRKLLLVGPPGTGKTMTAGVLAGELGLALFTIQLDSLITKFMGETAAKLRLIFTSIAETRAVYFFDEFDAIGRERGAQDDVGEIRRVLNSFLQFLEQDESPSLILAATNHPGLLDRALFRRFDGVIEYHLPAPEITKQILRSRLAILDTSEIDWERVVRSASGLSHSEVARASDEAAKLAILAETTRIATPALIEALEERRTAQPR